MQMGDAESNELEPGESINPEAGGSEIPEFSVASALSSQLNESSHPEAAPSTPFKSSTQKLARYTPYVFSGTATPDLSEKIVKMLVDHPADSFDVKLTQELPEVDVNEDSGQTAALSAMRLEAELEEDEIETYEFERRDTEELEVVAQDLDNEFIENNRDTLLLEAVAENAVAEVSSEEPEKVEEVRGDDSSPEIELADVVEEPISPHEHPTLHEQPAVQDLAALQESVPAEEPLVLQEPVAHTPPNPKTEQLDQAARVRRMMAESGAPMGPPPSKRPTGEYPTVLRQTAEHPAVNPGQAPQGAQASGRRGVPTPPIKKRRPLRNTVEAGPQPKASPNTLPPHPQSRGGNGLPPIPNPVVPGPNTAPPRRGTQSAPPLSSIQETSSPGEDATGIDSIVQQLLMPSEGEPQREQKVEWFTHYFNDDFLRSVSPKQQQRTRREVEFMLRSLKLSPGASLLDAACGYGRHTLEFAQRGYEVVGVDISMTMLKRALNESNKRSQRLKKNISARFMQGDMRAMDYKSEFDAGILWQDSLGYFDALGDADAVARIFQALKPGGRFLVDMINRDYIVPNLPSGRIWFGVQSEIHEEVNFEPETSILTMKRTFLTNNRTQVTDYTSHLRLYALHELINLLKYVGFSIVEVSGEIFYRGHHLGASSPRNIVLAERPRTAPR